MHRSTGDRLEDLLGNAGPEDAHLAHCGECSAELHVMREHADWMRHQLRAPEGFEPAPGFYARVLQRIEERAKRSIWYGLVYSPAGKRLAYASLSLALVLGLYVIAAEKMDPPAPAGARTVAVERINATQAAGEEQRDAVLVNFASYSGESGAP